MVVGDKNPPVGNRVKEISFDACLCRVIMSIVFCKISVFISVVSCTSSAVVPCFSKAFNIFSFKFNVAEAAFTKDF